LSSATNKREKCRILGYGVGGHPSSGWKILSELATTLAATRNAVELIITANVVASSLILSTLKMEVIPPSETSVLTRATRRHIPEDDILHSHRRENLNSYIAFPGWTLAS
jgi:hypothetical protein